MKRLKIGVVGLGEVAQIIHLPLLDRMDQKFEIAAICDISDSLLSFIGEKHRVPEAGRFTDFRSLVRLPELDAVFVLNSDDIHKESAITALREGKHVFVEKPMCLTIADAEAIIREKNAAKTLLATADMSIMEIAESLGFEEPSNFSRFNKSIVGVSPMQYRKNIRSSQPAFTRR